VVTTSGTACAEALAAAVEATYSSLPLVIITADRPKTHRGTGAPQTIEQVGIFSYYIEACFDLDAENTHFSLRGLSWRKPIHVNICFSEPLLDQDAIELFPPLKEERYHNEIIHRIQRKHNIFITNYFKKNNVIIKFINKL
jgi:2-succinyl-5-enolpyruvyl-6-hydroxy-3-cyclohexene-1-carboxylate synthase